MKIDKKAEEIVDFLEDKVRVSKKVHIGYIEWEKSSKSFIQIFGKYQYFYENSTGLISLIRINQKFNYGNRRLNAKYLKSFFWECYSMRGNHFYDVRRFNTKKEAEKFIYSCMGKEKS